MRGLGTFQISQMKHRDGRVFEMCQHLRSAIDLLERIASDPVRAPEEAAVVVAASKVVASPPAMPPEKLMYT